MSAGQLLRASRLRHGLTQQQLAIRARTSQAAISRIERGLVSPTVEMLQKLLGMVNEELVLSARSVPVSSNREVMRENLSLTPDERIEQGIARSADDSLVRCVASGRRRPRRVRRA